MAEKSDAEDKRVRKAMKSLKKSLNRYLEKLLDGSVGPAGGWRWTTRYPDFSKGVYRFVFPDGIEGSIPFIKCEELEIHKNDPCPICRRGLTLAFNPQFDSVPCLWCGRCGLKYQVVDSKLCLSESS